MRSVIVPLLLFASTVAVAGQASQQTRSAGRQPTEQQPITFRSGTEIVEVDVIVTDRNGNPVGDLRADEFEILENGQPHAIDLFIPVDLPFTRSERVFTEAGVAALPEPDVRSNGPESAGRLYVLVLDDLNTQSLRTPRVKEAARKFILEHLADNDYAALIFTSGAAGTSQELTNSKHRLLAAVDKFVGKKLLSSTLERLSGYQSERSRAASLETSVTTLADRLDPARAFRARQTFDALRSVGQYLTGVQGRRKSIVYVSEGVDYDFYDLVGENLSDAAAGPRSNASEVFSAAQDALAAVARAGAAIYAVDPRGLGQLGAENLDVKEMATEAKLGVGPATLQNELKVSQDMLRVVADETGGFAAMNTNQYLDAFERIQEENSRYYLLGYRPSTPRRPGRFNKIEVRVKRPGMTVRARRGYMVPRQQAPDPRLVKASAGTSPELMEALKSPVPLDGLILSTSAVAFQEDKSNASVAVIVQVDPRSLSFAEKDGRFSNALEISYLAVDQQGKTRAGKRDAITLNLRPETRDKALKDGIRIVSRISLPAGRYQLRVGARETNGGRIGSVAYDLDIPNFSREGLTMSALVVASRETGEIPTPQPDPAFDREFQVQPTTVRSFARGDLLRVATHLYVNGSAAKAPVEVETTLKGTDGRLVFRGQERYQPEGATSGYVHAANIPLTDAAPGTYVLQVSAKTNSTAPPVVRELPITVLPGT